MTLAILLPLQLLRGAAVFYCFFFILNMRIWPESGEIFEFFSKN